MNKSRILLSVFTSITILSTQILAEESVKSVESVDVWDTEVVSSSLNLGNDSIETKQADHLSDLLRDLPGVDVGGTHSINNRINIRGLTDENLDISIDGAKVSNSNMFHHIGNLLINPDILKRAEIEVGANSVVNGGLGGAVSFETKDGEDLLEDGQNYGARIQANYNSNDSVGGSIATYGKVGENADFMIYHNKVKKNNWKDGSGVETFGNEGDIENTLVKLGYKIGDKQKVIFSYDRLTDEGDYAPRPDMGYNANMAFTGTGTFPTKYTRDTATFKHELRLENTTVDTTVYMNENELEREEDLLGGSYRREGLLKGEVKTTGLNTKAQTNLEMGSLFHTFTYGASYDKQTSKVTLDGAKYGDDEKAITKVLYVEDAIDFNNGLLVTPGARYTMYDLEGIISDIDDSEMTYSLAVEYALTDTVTLMASATTLYKGVEMVDVLATYRLNGTNQNTDIKSETGINKEIGFKYVENGVLGADTFGFSFKYFNTTIEDYIDGESLTNVGDLDLKGFEATVVYDIGDLHSMATYARTETKYKDTGIADIKDPGDSLTLSLDYDIMSNLTVSWDAIYMYKELDVVDAGYNAKKAYNVHDFAMRWKPEFVKNLTVIAGIDNVFDKEYVSHISENRTARGTVIEDYEPGRSFKFSLAYKF